MKKIISVLLILVFVLSGCSAFTGVRIDKYNWGFSRIADTETSEVLFCAEKNALKYSGAQIADFECSAKDGKIIITNPATEESWTLEYADNKTVETNNTVGSIYDIYYKTETENLKGYATTGIASKSDIDDDYYLIITIGGYDLYFIDEAN